MNNFSVFILLFTYQADFLSRGPLTLKFDRTVDIGIFQNQQGHFENRDRGHCHFLQLPGDIGLFEKQREHFRNRDRGHCHFFKSTGDMGTPPSRAP